MSPRRFIWADTSGVLMIAIVGLGCLYTGYFLVSTLGAVFASSSLAAGHEIWINRFFLAFRYFALVAAPLAGLLSAARKHALAWLVLFLPLLIFGSVGLASVFQF